ncbi:hypothetical protein KAW48_04315, partial [candidate division WOR-3 bacterium]|nr:hypothetical protein [candidate division WOR-3 bacterium]
MRKILVLVCLMVMMGLWASEGVLLELKPSIDGKVSEYRVVKDLSPNLETRTLLKNSRDIGDANYCIQYDVDNWVYYCPRLTTDTMTVRFVSPMRCSVVAFTWISYCGTTGTVDSLVNVFVAEPNPSVDFSTYDGYEECSASTPSPLGTILWSGTSTCPDNMVWDTVNVPSTYIDPISNTFFCGWVAGADSEAMLCENPAYDGNPINVHSYRYNTSIDSWYAYYYTSGPDKLVIGMRAYVYCYCPRFLIVDPEELPYSYDTTARTVNIYGYDSYWIGFEEMVLHYSVNGGPEDTLVSTTPIEGDSTEGIWQLNIPGVIVGDTVDCYVVGKTYDALYDTTPTHTYTILQGTPGHFLYVDNDYTLSSALPGSYPADVWDYDVYGAPDSSVICFYANETDPIGKTIIWRDCGCTALGRGAHYGLGYYDAQFPSVSLYYSDSTWIKLLLDNGGRFWLSDQDQGYGLGICPSYGQQSVPE